MPLPQEQAAEELPTPPPEPRVEDAVRTPETAVPVNDSGNYNMEYDDVPDMDNDDVSETATSDAPTTPQLADDPTTYSDSRDIPPPVVDMPGNTVASLPEAVHTPDDDQALDSGLRSRRAVRRPGRFEDYLTDWQDDSEPESVTLVLEK